MIHAPVRVVLKILLIILMMSSASVLACSCKYRANYLYQFHSNSNISIVEIDQVYENEHYLGKELYRNSHAPFHKAKVKVVRKIKGKTAEFVFFPASLNVSTCIRGMSAVRGEKWLVMWNEKPSILLTHCSSFLNYQRYIDAWNKAGLIESE